MTTAATAPTPMVPIEDTETTSWLNETLRRERERVSEGPTAAAVDRIRARVFSQAEGRKTRKLAA